MRLEAYFCDACGHEEEEYFNDTEERPETLENPCPKCGGKLVKRPFKANSHRVYIQDRNVK